MLDCTGGAGLDAVTLANHGCAVHVVERNGVFACLLHAAIARYNAAASAGGGTRGHHRRRGVMSLTFGDATHVCADVAAGIVPRPQVLQRRSGRAV